MLDLIAPRVCTVCGRRLALEEEICCTACLMQMPLTGFMDDPYENELAKTFWGRVKHFERGFALLYHQPHAASAHPLYQLKYNHKADTGVDLGLLMGRMMLEHGFFEGIEAIIPVPLAKKRERERGYNQSLMLAKGLKKVSGVPIYNKVVKRISFEGSLTRKGRTERVESVAHVFELTDGESIRGKHVLVVDDVVTTGATISALAEQLQKAGDVHISVAALAFAGEKMETS